jgi:hypothetical protein
MGWVVFVAGMGNKIHTSISGIAQWKCPLPRPYLKFDIIFSWILKKLDLRLWTYATVSREAEW